MRTSDGNWNSQVVGATHRFGSNTSEIERIRAEHPNEEKSVIVNEAGMARILGMINLSHGELIVASQTSSLILAYSFGWRVFQNWTIGCVQEFCETWLTLQQLTTRLVTASDNHGHLIQLRQMLIDLCIHHPMLKVKDHQSQAICSNDRCLTAWWPARGDHVDKCCIVEEWGVMYFHGNKMYSFS